MNAGALRRVARKLIVRCLGFLVLLWAAALATGCGGDAAETGPAEGPVGKQAAALAVTSPIELSAASDTAATGQVASWTSGDFLAQWGLTQRYDSSGALLSSSSSIQQWQSVSGADNAGNYAFMTTASFPTYVAAVLNFVSPADTVTSQVTLLDAGLVNSLPGSLAINASGVVAATFWQGGAAPLGAYLRAFSDDGTPLCTASEPLGFSAPNDGNTAAVAVDGTGVIHVVLNDVFASAVYYQRYSSTCAPLTTRMQVNTSTENVWHAAVAADAYGNAVVAFEVIDTTFDSFDTYVQSIAANGTLLGGNQVVNDVGANANMPGYDSIAIGIMDTGPFVVALPELRPGRPSPITTQTCCDITVREFNPGGGLLDTFVASDTSVGAWSPSLAMAPSGNYWVGWQESTPAGQGYATSVWALGGRHDAQPPVVQMTDAEQYNFSVSGQDSPMVYYALSVEPGAQALTVLVSAPGGNVTMYERLGGLPYSNLSDLQQSGLGKSATVSVPNPPPGVYYLGFYNSGPSGDVASVSLLATAKPIFTISETPASITVPEGTSGTSNITTAAVGGSGMVSLSASAPPGVGITPTLSPSSVTSGDPSTLTVVVSATTPTGTYPITITGQEGSFTQQTTVSVTVPPDFSISATPSAVRVTEGSSGTSTIATTATTGTGTVSFVATGMPAGVTAAFSAQGVNVGGTSTLTLAVAAGTAPSTYPITVTGTESTAGGVVSHTTTVNLTVPPPDFTLSPSPASVSVAEGHPGVSTITATAANGSGTVTLSASGMPSGITATFSSTSVTTTGSSTLTLGTNGSTPPGTYSVTVTGTETVGGSTHTTSVSVIVPPPDFTITASPSSVSAWPGASGDGVTSIHTTAVDGDGTVTLSAPDMPAGIAATFSPQSVPAGDDSTLTLTVAATVAPGPYTVTVTGTETPGSNTHTTTVYLDVPAPDFTLSTSTSSLTVPEGSSQTVTISTGAEFGSGNVSLSATGAPSGVTPTLSSTLVVAGNGSTLTLAVAPGTVPSSYPIIITGQEGGYTRTATVTLVVPAPDFTLSTTTSSLTVPEGTSATVTISTAAEDGIGNVTLTASAPSGVTATLSASSVTAGSSSTLTVAVGAGTAPGSYTVTVGGSEGTFTQSVSIALVVPDFTLSASPSTFKLARDTSATSTISTTLVGGEGTLSLGATGVPTGVTATFDVTSLQAGQSATLTLAVSASAVTGDYTITITGTEGTDVHTTPVALTVEDVVLNPSFESGKLSPWIVTGTASISTTAYAGSYSAELGASTPTSGASTLSQTFVMPAAATKLSVWYDVTCPGTVATDWAGATVQDQVTGATIVLLPDTCTLGQGWQEAIANVSSMAGDMVTLTLINHDGDANATYTLFDDVVVKQ